MGFAKTEAEIAERVAAFLKAEFWPLRLPTPNWPNG